MSNDRDNKKALLEDLPGWGRWGGVVSRVFVLCANVDTNFWIFSSAASRRYTCFKHYIICLVLWYLSPCPIMGWHLYNTLSSWHYPDRPIFLRIFPHTPPLPRFLSTLVIFRHLATVLIQKSSWCHLQFREYTIPPKHLSHQWRCQFLRARWQVNLRAFYSTAARKVSIILLLIVWHWLTLIV